MRIHAAQPLFAWGQLEDCPFLNTIRDCLLAVPDQNLLDDLRQARGKGRNDYAIEALWGVVLLTVLLRHTHFNDCLAELHRNPPLCRLIGITCEEQISNEHNLSRFLDTLGQQPHLQHLRDIFDVLVGRLGQAIPHLGRKTAGDATGLSARAKKSLDGVAEEVKAGLPQPTGGRKEYRDDDGRVTEVVEWFGYKLHLLVDVEHEVVLAYHVSDTKAGDNEWIADLLKQAEADLGAGCIQTLAYDKAADDGAVHEELARRGIRPLIQIRTLWKEEPERAFSKDDVEQPRRIPLNVVHGEAGTLFCYDMTSNPPVRHSMSSTGYEKDRGTLKYRCPARHEGRTCPHDGACNEGKSYGMQVRLPKERDLRRFPPIPRATKEFERRYKGRTVVEWVNARLKVFWGADDGNVTGAFRFHAQIGVVFIVHAVFAALLARAPRWEGPLGQTRLGTVAQALRQPPDDTPPA